MPEYDIVVKIVFNLKDQDKTVIKTNAKKEAVADMLEAWLRTQINQGKDGSNPSKKDEYKIEIRVDLSSDRFSTFSDTGSKSVTCGIVMNVLGRLGNIIIQDLS